VVPGASPGLIHQQPWLLLLCKHQEMGYLAWIHPDIELGEFASLVVLAPLSKLDLHRPPH